MQKAHTKQNGLDGNTSSSRNEADEYSYAMSPIVPKIKQRIEDSNPNLQIGNLRQNNSEESGEIDNVYDVAQADDPSQVQEADRFQPEVQTKQDISECSTGEYYSQAVAVGGQSRDYDYAYGHIPPSESVQINDHSQGKDTIYIHDMQDEVIMKENEVYG